MRDKRPVDELSIEELERVLAIRRRELRQRQLTRMQRDGRIVATTPPADAPFDITQVDPLADRPAPPAPVHATLADADVSAAPAYIGEATPTYEAPRRARAHAAWRAFLNRGLLLVEVAAVLGLFFLGAQMLSGISTLQSTTAQAQSDAERLRSEGIPTAVPTPQMQLASFVLPGGHTPPTEPGGGQFNFAEIPANVLPAVRDQIFLPPEISRPPQTDETPLRLIIPKINVDQAIVQGTDWEALKQGIGQELNGATPIQSGANVVLAAHNDIYGEVFRHLDQLEPGDQFEIRTRTRSYTYTVTGWEVVAPTDTHVMAPRGYAASTLISCYPYQVNSQRIVVFAERNEL
jgi:sortase A